jgi:hypothetical protein
MSVDYTVSQAIRAHNATMCKLYFEHRETVQQLQHTLLTQILPNVVDELALGNPARDWVEEWLQDDCRSLFSFSLPHRVFSLSSSVYIPHAQGESVCQCRLPHSDL